MKFLIWFLYLAAASVVSFFLLPLANTAATSEGSALFAGFIALVIYGAAIAGARATCKWLSRRGSSDIPAALNGSLSRVSSRKIKMPVALVLCALLVSVSSIVSWMLSSNHVEKQYLSEISELMAQNNSDLTTARVSSYGQGYQEGYDAAESEVSPELDFYRNHACIVTTAGEKYHRWDCPHISGRDLYIYNIELAESMGYEPCADCWDSGRGSLRPLQKLPS